MHATASRLDACSKSSWMVGRVYKSRLPRMPFGKRVCRRKSWGRRLILLASKQEGKEWNHDTPMGWILRRFRLLWLHLFSGSIYEGQGTHLWPFRFVFVSACDGFKQRTSVVLLWLFSWCIRRGWTWIPPKLIIRTTPVPLGFEWRSQELHVLFHQSTQNILSAAAAKVYRAVEYLYTLASRSPRYQVDTTPPRARTSTLTTDWPAYRRSSSFPMAGIAGKKNILLPSGAFYFTASHHTRQTSTRWARTFSDLMCRELSRMHYSGSARLVPLPRLKTLELGVAIGSEQRHQHAAVSNPETSRMKPPVECKEARCAGLCSEGACSEKRSVRPTHPQFTPRRGKREATAFIHRASVSRKIDDRCALARGRGFYRLCMPRVCTHTGSVNLSSPVTCCS